MADNNNTSILLKEIETMLEGMANRPEGLPTVIYLQRPDWNGKRDSSPIKDTFAEAAKANLQPTILNPTDK